MNGKVINKMYQKLFVFSLAVMTLQAAIVLPYAYSQTNNDIIEKEFHLLCKEVLLGILSNTNGQRILKGEEPQPDDPMDMNLSFTWWESSTIFETSRARSGGLWNKTNPNWDNMTYGEKYAEITALPSLAGLEKLKSLDVSETISRDPRREDIPVKREPVKLTIPNITWTPGQTWKRNILGYDSEKISDLGIWHHPQETKWLKREAAASAVAFIAYLILNRYDEKIIIDPVTKKEFADWPPIAPVCWTACAEGEPIYNRPTLPKAKMSIEEWEAQHLGRWYLTPNITEIVISPGEEKTSWTAYARYIALTVSIDLGTHALRRWIQRKEIFPE